ncbi:MAG: deoxyhypusine synthase family protein [Myxococcota bacterium]|nr:deoxyhypusine synthase family protein [Myxococcota bacterium]
MSKDTTRRELADGSGLEALETLDLGKIGDADQLLAAMGSTAFGGRNLGEAAEALHAMVTDPRCGVVMTLSGAMTVAKMGLVITEMVERGWVQAIVSTGALMTHGMVELAGMSHYKARPDLNDAELFDKGYNRVYDTYELEESLNSLGSKLRGIFKHIDAELDVYSSWHLTQQVGKYLASPGTRGILSACYRKGVPVFIPALTDSEFGLDLATFYMEQMLRGDSETSVSDGLGKLRSKYDPFLDLAHYTRFVLNSDRLGIFTIGGGVPRNWAQQASPFVDYMNKPLGRNEQLNRFRYAVRICPEPTHWGGLSGCTYSEGVSWGKFVPPAEGGRFAEVYADATLVWPLLVQGVIQRMEKNGEVAQTPSINLPGFQPPQD